VDPAKQQLSAALGPLVGKLAFALSLAAAERPVQATSVAVDPAKSREAGARLSSLLAEFDPGAADFIEANRAVLQPLFADDSWSKFEKLVQDYAFDEAQAQLKQALSPVSD
jgi:hypothetical protein